MPGLPSRQIEWRLSPNVLMGMLARCYQGEDPDLVYAEMLANSEIEDSDAQDG
jgi:hypothetical protein